MFLDQIISQADSSAEPTQREVGHQTHPQSDTAKYAYLGPEAHGRFRVSKDGITYLVSGILYERRRYADESGQKKWKRHKVATTPGYGNQADSEHSVIARCVNSGVMYRIVGVFQAEVALPIDAAVALKANTTASATALAAHEPQCISVRLDKTHHVKAFRRHDFASIVAQREAGLDPDLRMSFITVFLNESKANLYRKMGKGFPPPIKRGKGSFWPMSQIEAYKAGQLVGGAS